MIVLLAGLAVPYGTFKRALVTSEFSPSSRRPRRRSTSRALVRSGST